MEEIKKLELKLKLKKMSPEEIYSKLNERFLNLNNEFQEIMLMVHELEKRLPPEKPEGELEELTEILSKKAFYALQEIPTIGISKASSICREICENVPYLNVERDVTIRDLCSLWKTVSGHYYGVGKSTETIVYSYLTKTLKIPSDYFK